MKSLFIIVSFLLVHAAQAVEPTQCLQWELRTENSFVTQAVAVQVANSIIANGTLFGMHTDGSKKAGGVTSYFFKYNREFVLKTAQRTSKYSNWIVEVKRQLESREGFFFECSFVADGPRPRISGGSVR